MTSQLSANVSAWSRARGEAVWAPVGQVHPKRRPPRVSPGLGYKGAEDEGLASPPPSLRVCKEPLPPHPNSWAWTSACVTPTNSLEKERRIVSVAVCAGGSSLARTVVVTRGSELTDVPGSPLSPWGVPCLFTPCPAPPRAGRQSSSFRSRPQALATVASTLQDVSFAGDPPSHPFPQPARVRPLRASLLWPRFFHPS